MHMDRSDPEYAEAYGKLRQHMLFGLPVGLLVLVVGLVQGITWLWIVGAVVLLLAAANLIFMGRMKPTSKG
jgi:type IV secretory pathway VirB3-like protein